MTKKLMALLLAVLMAVSLLPMPAMAGDAQVITDLSGISAGGSYVVDKSVKDIVLSAPLTLDKDVTLELTGQTVTLKPRRRRELCRRFRFPCGERQSDAQGLRHGQGAGQRLRRR